MTMANWRAHLGVFGMAATCAGLLAVGLACGAAAQKQPDAAAAELAAAPKMLSRCHADTDCKRGRVCRSSDGNPDHNSCFWPGGGNVAVASGAGCSKDSDCKGNRVCNNGQCVADNGYAPPPVAPPAATPAPVAAASYLRGQPQPAAFALIIGIERYRDVPAAVGARRDAQRFAEIAKTTLGVKDGNLRVAIDDRATKGDIEKELEWLKTNVPNNGRVYFFYSGHGAPDASAGTPYILPYDGDAKFVDKTGMQLADVMKRLGGTKAKEVLAVVDSCFSGAGGRSVLPEGARPLVKMKETAPVAHVSIFSAASGAEISGPADNNDGGLFSKYVAEGIGTAAADIDGDGTVSLKELSDWVTPRVAREAKRSNREQTPSLAVGTGTGAADFAVAYGIAK
jgi:hypothetical protein